MMNVRRLGFGVVCLALGLELCARCVTAAGEATDENSILGWYYFKSLRLMEIRREGGAIVSRMHGELEDWAEVGQPGKARELGMPFATTKGAPHRGVLKGDAEIEFANYPFTAENFLQRGLGMSGERATKELAKLGPDDSSWFDDKVTYYERWKLLPGGKLQVEATFTIPNPCFGEHTKEFMDKHLGGKGGKNLFKPGNYRAICGWKVTDPRELQAWQELEQNRFQQAAALFRKVVDSRAGWPFPCLGEALALTGAKDFTGARNALQLAQKRLNEETRPYLQQRIYFTKDQIYSYETVASGKDLAAWFASVHDKIPRLPKLQLANKPARTLSPAELQEVHRLLQQYPNWAAVEATASLRGRGELFPLSQKAMRLGTSINMKVPNFLELQNLAKLLLLRGHLARANQRPDVAIQQYCLAIKLGQETRHGIIISHLIGVAMEAIGIRGMSELLEDGLIDSPALLQRFEQFVAYLALTEPIFEPYEMLSGEFSGGFSPSTNHLFELIIGAIAIPNLMEFQTRADVVRARLCALQAAVLLKKQQLKGPFPASLDTSAFPEDPFASGQKLRYLGKGATGLIHSVGPDRADNQGAVEYDPTNGMTSPGDIILKVK